MVPRNHIKKEGKMDYLVYDIESIVDKKLLNEILFSGEGLSDEQAYQKEVAKVLEEKGNTFVNPSFHVPICLAALALDKNFSLLKIGLLGGEKKTPGSIVKHFWEMYNESGFVPVDFNGRGYDMRLLELWAYRQGITIHYKHFDKFGVRYRYADDKHLDLLEVLTNNFSIRLQGGLDYFAKLLGKPGKMGTKGDMIEGLYQRRDLFRIEDYCLGDAFDTYYVFLRWMVVRGKISLEDEQGLVKKSLQMMQEFSDKTGYLKKYQQNIKEWKPWE